MDAARCPQGNGLARAVENLIRPTEKKPRPEKEKALNCPRCNSTNTKFCYYNNYSLSQPRYFCKTCRRYWTQGGTLRNVPVGGGSRKARRSYASSSSSSISSGLSSKKVNPNLSLTRSSSQNPKIYQGQDLNLIYDPPIFNGVAGIVDLPFGLDLENFNPRNPNCPSPSSSQAEVMKSGNMSSGGLSSLTSIPVSSSNSVYTSNFPILDFKPSLGFSLDGLDNMCVNMQAVQDHHTNSSGALFPFEELKTGSVLEQLHDTRQGEMSNGYWNQCWLGVPDENV